MRDQRRLVPTNQRGLDISVNYTPNTLDYNQGPSPKSNFATPKRDQSIERNMEMQNLIMRQMAGMLNPPLYEDRRNSQYDSLDRYRNQEVQRKIDDQEIEKQRERINQSYLRKERSTADLRSLQNANPLELSQQTSTFDSRSEAYQTKKSLAACFPMHRSSGQTSPFATSLASAPTSNEKIESLQQIESQVGDWNGKPNSRIDKKTSLRSDKSNDFNIMKSDRRTVSDFQQDDDSIINDNDANILPKSLPKLKKKFKTADQIDLSQAEKYKKQESKILKGAII